MSDDTTESEPPSALPGGSGDDITESEPPSALPGGSGDDITESEPPRSLKAKVVQPRRRTKSLHEQRFDLARLILFAVALLAAGLLAASVFAPVERLETIKSLAPVLFGPLVTLFGTSVAWYYATDNKSDKETKKEPEKD